jgi:hypothetical protein
LNTNLVSSNNLASVLGRDTAHYILVSLSARSESPLRLTVIMHSRQDRNRLFGDINAGEDSCGLGDTGETFVEDLRGEMTELQEDMVLVRSNTTAFADFDGH